MPFSKVNPDPYVKGLFLRSEHYAQNVKGLYDDATDKIIKMVNLYPGIDPKKTFSFRSYPKLEAEVNKILKELYSQVYATTKGGIEAEWSIANAANDNLVKAIFGTDSITDSHYAKLFNRNEKALDSFISRSTGEPGLNLSQRIWNYSGQLKNEMNLCLAVSVGEGKSAGEISREVRSYLKEPDKLFRRVRDEKGNLKLSKAAQAYNPGQGVYRSSYKNAMRVTRSETNMAYKASDFERFQQLDFIQGYEVKLSKMHPVRMPQGDICDDLQGRYPKDFKFVGWHSMCMCYVTSILLTDKEFSKYQDALLAGEDTSNFRSSNSVNEMPKQFHSWVAENTERGKEKKSQPYFIKDNFVNGRIEKGLKPEITKKS